MYVLLQSRVIKIEKKSLKRNEKFEKYQNQSRDVFRIHLRTYLMEAF